MEQTSKTVEPTVSVQPLLVMRTGDEAPEEGRPVLALIHHTRDLGPAEWREVVHHDGNEWRSFAGSDTFEDGERVVRWVYAEEVLP